MPRRIIIIEQKAHKYDATYAISSPQCKNSLDFDAIPKGKCKLTLSMVTKHYERLRTQGFGVHI